MSDNEGLFSDLRVVEVASMFMAPIAGTIMADFGAEVIKVEAPEGDMLRQLHTIRGMPESDVDYCHMMVNRNKKGIVLDLKQPDAAKALRPGCGGWATDVCVPISRLAECILETQKDVEQSFLIAPLVGHAGDGNFHLVFLLDTDKPEELHEAQRLNDRLIERALAMDGTCTGEHGIGLGKRKYLRAEHGEAVTAMRAIKDALDPQNIMNPGKMFED